MNNKTHFNFFTIVSVFILLALNSFGNSGKYYSNYKSFKKSIDSIYVLQPFSLIYCLSDTSDYEDTKQNTRTSKLLIEKVTAVLKNKYILSFDENTNNTLSYQDEIIKLFNELDSVNDPSKPFKTPKFLDDLLKDKEEQYILIPFLNGKYRKGANQTDMIMDGGRTLMIRNDLYMTEIAIILLDNFNHQILFYNYKFSSQSDPRIKSHVDLLMGKVLMPVFRK